MSRRRHSHCTNSTSVHPEREDGVYFDGLRSWRYARPSERKVYGCGAGIGLGSYPLTGGDEARTTWRRASIWCALART
jgi:hypothetical protein